MNSYLFAGEQRDAATGLDYLRARWVNSATGRFVSRDSFKGSLRDPVTLHKYLYANANPTVFIDPTGKFSLQEFSVGQSIQNTLGTISRVKIVQNQLETIRFIAEALTVGMFVRAAFFTDGLSSGFSKDFPINGKVFTSVGGSFQVGSSALVLQMRFDLLRGGLVRINLQKDSGGWSFKGAQLGVNIPIATYEPIKGFPIGRLDLAFRGGYPLSSNGVGFELTVGHNGVGWKLQWPLFNLDDWF